MFYAIYNQKIVGTTPTLEEAAQMAFDKHGINPELFGDNALEAFQRAQEAGIMVNWEILSEQDYMELLEEEYVMKVRGAVLEAIDSVTPGGKGWRDADLPGIFPALDKLSRDTFKRVWAEGHRDFSQTHEEAPDDQPYDFELRRAKNNDGDFCHYMIPLSPRAAQLIIDFRYVVNDATRLLPGSVEFTDGFIPYELRDDSEHKFRTRFLI